MPIKIKSGLPAVKILESENIFVMTDKRAVTQDIRPLKIAIINLMPTKETTETQLLRLLGNTPLQIEVSLVRMENHVSTHVGADHLEKFYISSEEVFKHKYDGMIITGAPVEQMEFEQVDYWNDLCRIMDYAKTNVFSTLYICWGAQAGLYHHYGIPKYPLDKKMFGIFKNTRSSGPDPLLRGFDDVFPIPQSRHTTIKKEDILRHKDLKILAESKDIGVSIIKTKDNRAIFMTGHLEYDTETLKTEYLRDLNKGLPIEKPINYFPENNADIDPYSTWRSTAHLFYSNWLNYYVYQETPFNFA
ncbi:MAG: homoserine O-succinyltransferase [Treponema sp.]|uniref:homoserine O-acetyltransferase MetA n=1 Tax=Treponema sp. TaxID=166 RepID=UPI00298E74E3|nr:homoserine O-succinyltransferase [Treponema sp.]MBR5932582.1 homoserine O-succinyltransferase [Treponema sp.]